MAAARRLHQRAAIKLEVDDKSLEWERRQKRTEKAANTARGEKLSGNKNAAKEKENSPAHNVRDTVSERDHEAERARKTTTAVAKEVGSSTRVVEHGAVPWSDETPVWLWFSMNPYPLLPRPKVRQN